MDSLGLRQTKCTEAEIIHAVFRSTFRCAGDSTYWSLVDDVRKLILFYRLRDAVVAHRLRARSAKRCLGARPVNFPRKLRYRLLSLGTSRVCEHST